MKELLLSEYGWIPIAGVVVLCWLFIVAVIIRVADKPLPEPWSPFDPNTGLVRDDLFAQVLIKGKWVPNPEPNEGFHLLGHLDDSIENLALIEWLRTVFAHELGGDPAKPWFYLSYPQDDSVASGDEALLALFKAEREYHDSDMETALVMCHG